MACNDHIVIAAGTVQNQNTAALVPAAHNSNMGILRVKDQISNLCVRPGDIGAVTVLGHSSSSVADDVFAAGDIIKHPIDKSAAIQPVGAVGAGGGVACGGDFPERAPAGVPADHQGFNSDR